MFRALRLKRNLWQDVRVEDLMVTADSSDRDIFDDLTPANVDVE
jgi:hypothetical protein